MREHISTRKKERERERGRLRSDRVTEQKEDRKRGWRAEEKWRRRKRERQLTGESAGVPPTGLLTHQQCSVH